MMELEYQLFVIIHELIALGKDYERLLTSQKDIIRYHGRLEDENTQHPP